MSKDNSLVESENGAASPSAVHDSEKPKHYELVDGLRAQVDGVDHSHYNSKSIGFIMTVLGCSFALTSSQIAPLLYLTLVTHIAHELNVPDLSLWMLTSQIVAMGALAPFVGPLADLFGRKTIFLLGIVAAIVGSVICAVTPNAAGFIAGQCLLGVGAVIEELMAIAVVAESVPTAKRPIYAVVVLSAIIPWSPGTMYANWMATVSWKWVGCALALWNVLVGVLIAPFYHPPPRVNSMGLSRKEILSRIDFIGGLLITAGMIFFLIALGWGGQQYPWESARVLSFLIIGICLMIGFGVWQIFAKYPLYSHRMIYAPRPFFCMILVIFAAGINYVPLVVFWPIESISVFNSDRFQTGVNTVPIGTCILAGAIMSAFLLGAFKRHVTLIMTCFCVVQTIGCACLTAIDPHNINTAFAPVVLALIGVGGVLVPNQVIITVITPDDLIGSVTALTVGLRAQAQVIGLAIFYNRFVHEVSSNAIKYVLPAAMKVGIRDIEGIVAMVEGMSAVPYKEYAPAAFELLRDPANYEVVRLATVDCFAQAFRFIYFITIAFGVPACIAAAFMGDVSKYMDSHVAVAL